MGPPPGASAGPRGAPRGAAAWVAATLAAACAAGAGSGREVVAPSPDEAARCTLLVAELEPGIRALLPGTWAVDLEVVLEEEWDAAGPGYTEIDPDAAGGPRATIHLDAAERDRRGALAHELVHALLGPEWRVLPPLVEEGLCTWVAERLEPLDAPARAARLARLGAYLGELALPLDHVDPATGERVSTAVFVPFERRREPSSPGALLRLCGRAAYTDFCASAGVERAARFQEVGYLLARRALGDRGPAGLHAICRRAWDSGLACVPPEWLLEAARLDAHADWLAAAWATADPEAFEVLLRELPELSAEPLAWACAELRAGAPELDPDLDPDLDPVRDPERFWERVDPRLSFPGGATLRLADVPAVRGPVSGPTGGPAR